MSGPVSASTARQLRDNGGYSPMALYVDAKSVYSAVSATMIRAPADKSLLCHVQYLRELLNNRVLSSLVWMDTRDMTADGLTKGAVDRGLLHKLMDGTMEIVHTAEEWHPRRYHEQSHEAGQVFFVPATIETNDTVSVGHVCAQRTGICGDEHMMSPSSNVPLGTMSIIT